MKIYEIIAENKQKADEGIASKIAAPLISRIAKAAEPVANKITTRAAKSAEKVAARDVELAANLKTLRTVFGAGTDALIKIFYAWGIAEPMFEAGMEIARLNKQLASGQLSQDQYDNNIRLALGKCTTQVLASVAFKTALKTGAGIIKSIPFPGTESLGLLINKMTPAATAAFSAWLATPGPLGGQDTFTQWFVGKSFSAGVARDWMGSLTESLYNTILGKATAISSGKTDDSSAETNILPLDKSSIEKSPGQSVPAATGPASVERDPYTGARLN